MMNNLGLFLKENFLIITLIGLLCGCTKPTLKEVMDSPDNYAVVDLSFQRLYTLPASVGTWQQVEELNLANTYLDSLPKELFTLKNLKKLDLGWNNLKTLPVDIGQLSSLEELILDGNSLSTLPPELTKLTKLKKLSISWNHLTDIPAGIENLPLTTLELYDNTFANEVSLQKRFTKLPLTFDFAHLESLETSLLQKASDYQNSHQDSLALYYYSKAQRLFPNQITIYKNRGLLRVRMYDFEGANQDFTQALALEPNNAELHFYKGEVFFLMKNLPQACGEWAKGAELGNPQAVQRQQQTCK